MLSLTLTLDITSEKNTNTFNKDVENLQAPIVQVSKDSMNAEGSSKRKISEMLLQTIDLVDYNEEKAQKRKIAQDTDVFNIITRDLAVPGNTMFSQEPRLLDRLVIESAPAIAIPKLVTPNLLMDLAEQPGPATLSSTIRLNLSGLPNREPSSLSGHEFKETATQSPLGFKTAASSTINSPITATSNSSMPLLEELAFKSPSIKSLTLNASLATSRFTTSSNKASPISLVHLSSTSADQKTSKGKSKSKKKLTISLPNPKPDLKLVIPAFALKQISTQVPVASIINEETKNERTVHSVWSVTDPEPLPAAAAAAAAAVAAKIRFKIKLPESTNSVMDTPPSSPQNTRSSVDAINCICETPNLDYGAFMIACNTCGVWFHGPCVGMIESDQVNEWNCSRCCVTSPAT